MVRQTRDIVAEEKQGFLGITGADVTSTNHETFGIPVGVFVNSVVEGLAADKAGIKKGYVITKFDGYSVTTIAQLQDRLRYYKEGESVTVTAMVPDDGGYKEKEFRATLSNKSKNIANE
jgi:serine protease Do